ncbi:MAG: SHOCT domain-containing protein [Candidatus Nanohaloarchaea archaeon]
MSTDAGFRVVLLVIAAVVFAPLLLMVVAFPLMGMWTGHMWTGTGFTFPVLLLWLLLSGMTLGIGYLIYRASTGTYRDRAIEELREAYARGDLDEEEFEERKEKLLEEE